MEKSTKDEIETKFSLNNLSKKAKIIIISFISIIVMIGIIVPLVLLSFHKIGATEVNNNF